MLFNDGFAAEIISVPQKQMLFYTSGGGVHVTIELNEIPDSCHFIGVGGIGMSGLAKILLERKCKISGSDLSTSEVMESLKCEGAVIHHGHAAEYVEEGVSVIYSSGISQDNLEWKSAREKGCSIYHRSELLQKLVQAKSSLAVAGTHGKTTVSSLLAHVLIEAGRDPSYAVGGILLNQQTNASWGEGEQFVFEADESDGTFVHYKPYGAIVTNLDEDHMDHFGTRESLCEAFEKFMRQVQSEELLFVCGDDRRLSSLVEKKTTYGISEGCDWRAVNVRQEGWFMVFDVVSDTTFLDVKVSLAGRHQVLNSLAVFGLALTLRIEEGIVRSALESFKGVGRRCERVEKEGVLFVDDYAHHPVEIETTLSAIREAVGRRRIWVLFQPHRYSRTRDCLGLMGPLFSEADELLVTDIYGAGEEPVEGLDGSMVSSVIGRSSRYIARGGLSEIADQLLPYDVVVTFGAGDITGVRDEIFQRWKAKPRKKLRLALICGGRSAEHFVSLVSAKYIRDALQKDYYELIAFGVDRGGSWSVGVEGAIESGEPLEEEEGPVMSHEVLDQLLSCDIAFPVFHGPFGEDGTVQGMLEMFSIPYMGCGVGSSAVAMDKNLCKTIIHRKGVRTAPWVKITEELWRRKGFDVLVPFIAEHSYPFYVKPNHLGSSMGITRVEREEDFEGAVRDAFRYGDELLVEKAIEGRELEFGVVGVGSAIQVFLPCEILKGEQDYTLENKYGEDTLPITISPDMTEEQLQRGMELAKIVYQEIGGDGFARVDFFLDREGQFVLGEVNPIPGLTPTSAFPRAMQKCFCVGEFIDRLAIQALYRNRMRINVPV